MRAQVGVCRYLGRYACWHSWGWRTANASVSASSKFTVGIVNEPGSAGKKTDQVFRRRGCRGLLFFFFVPVQLPVPGTPETAKDSVFKTQCLVARKESYALMGPAGTLTVPEWAVSAANAARADQCPNQQLTMRPRASSAARFMRQ